MEDAPGRLLTSTQAAGYLSVARSTIRNWANSGRLPVVLFHGDRYFRFLVSDLDEAILKHRYQVKTWFLRDNELPRAIVERLLNITGDSVSIFKQRGTLKDYSPESIRAYMMKQARRDVGPGIRLKYKRKLELLQLQLWRLKKKYENR